MTFHSIGLVLVMGIVPNKIMSLEVPFKIQSKEAIRQNLREKLFVRLYSTAWTPFDLLQLVQYFYCGFFGVLYQNFSLCNPKICFDDSSIRMLTGKRTDPTSNCSN